jgi:hypothetical protein
MTPNITLHSITPNKNSLYRITLNNITPSNIAMNSITLNNIILNITPNSTNPLVCAM